ncbi:hypothetical protein PR202_gb14001 [Eleusine coracana subsp. coracana]|uniref:Uncharacterized protein n=1 Tax=Eleusine coracana subsp. coracana TaxID=191504 RepID=A0AAV5ERU7_ELECO|nr:hypothetical protein PR202_gb14001 [Eleusine coracana subsp. coracana]
MAIHFGMYNNQGWTVGFRKLKNLFRACYIKTMCKFYLFFKQLKDTHKVEHEEIKKIVASSNVSIPACIATALTSTVVGLCC